MSNTTTMKKFRSIFILTFIVVALFASGCTKKNLNTEQIAAKMMDNITHFLYKKKNFFIQDKLI
jgi:outer membrane lipoprotein-sorting protein